MSSIAPAARPRQETDAERLRALLARAGLSQRAFARLAEVSYRAVNAWTSGAVPVPALVLLAAEQLASRASPALSA